ncbi:hypothetical protein NQ317_001715 [Molorchus minor]|uniref:Cytochrome P450 n=1 Tax=Molorchus minor TaxID=1323400 RepID=A0ABQ9IYQ3_9CUCU|nr:hypothetical protein NQ317_001715 [Molorchus minor]
MDFYLCFFITNLLGLPLAIYAFFKWKHQYWKRKNVPTFEPSIPFGNLENPLARTIAMDERYTDMYVEAKKKVASRCLILFIVYAVLASCLRVKGSFQEAALIIFPSTPIKKHGRWNEKMAEMGQEEGWKHLELYMFTRPTYMVMDLDMVRNVMSRDFQYFEERGPYINEKGDPMSANVFFIGGHKWKNIRTKLTPAFTPVKLKNNFQMMVDYGKVLEKYFEEKAVQNRQPIEIKDTLDRYFMDLILCSEFSINCHSLDNPSAEFRTHGKQVFNGGKFKNLRFLFGFTYPNFCRALGMRLIPKHVNDFFVNTITEIVKYRQEKNVRGKDFIQLLIDLRNNKAVPKDWHREDGEILTMGELSAQCLAYFMAGYETSSSALTFTLFELARNPDIQKRVRKELETVLAAHNHEITYEVVLTDLKYAKQVIDEALRLYPVSSVLTRVCVKDYRVPESDLTIDKGTVILIPVKGIHKDGQYYEKPDEYDPERFSDVAKQARKPLCPPSVRRRA